METDLGHGAAPHVPPSSLRSEDIGRRAMAASGTFSRRIHGRLSGTSVSRCGKKSNFGIACRADSLGSLFPRPSGVDLLVHGGNLDSSYSQPPDHSDEALGMVRRSRALQPAEGDLGNGGSG